MSAIATGLPENCIASNVLRWRKSAHDALYIVVRVYDYQGGQLSGSEEYDYLPVHYLFVDSRGESARLVISSSGAVKHYFEHYD